MNTYKLFWSPEGKCIATVQARDMKAAIRKAPQPYRKYLGEIYAESECNSLRSGARVAVKCDQCQMVSINGHACHCPNRNSVWNAERERWIKQRECRECGSMIELGEICDCQDTEELS